MDEVETNPLQVSFVQFSVVSNILSTIAPINIIQTVDYRRSDENKLYDIANEVDI